MEMMEFVQQVDKLGRFAPPAELRRILDNREKDSIEFFTDKAAIILKRHRPYCVFCHSVDNLIEYGGHSICPGCVREIGRGA